MHHADLEFDVTTGVRFHPVEIMLSMVIKLGVVAALGASALTDIPQMPRLPPGIVLLRRSSVNHNACSGADPCWGEPMNSGPQPLRTALVPLADLRRIILPSAPTTAMVCSGQAATMGGPRKRSIRRRIAANSARGTATSASWKTR
jgi:hypothetical protein